MIWLQGQTLTPRQVFWPESMSLTLEERRSSASMTLGPDGPALSVGDWLKDDKDPGAGIIWRVKSIDMQYDTQTRTVSLEHIVNTLKDWVLFGEHTYEAMGGSNGGAPAKLAIQYILAHAAGLWELGAYEHPPQSEPYKFEGDTLFSALETVSGTLEDPFWEYDLTKIPFRLNMRKLTDKAAENEMRMTRNIQTLKRTVDRSRMYTRIFPIGYDDLHISGNFISRNENKYGVVCSVQTNQGLSSEAELRMWAEARLKRHCEPAVTVTVKGLALAADTGEPLDRLTLGRRCRIPLPEFNTTITETINRLQYSDKVRNPQQVTVTMANLQEDIANLFESSSSSSASSTRGSGSRSKKKAEEDHAWFVDTTEHVGMVAEALIGRDKDGVDWSRVSRIIVDGTGIHQTVQETSGELVRQSSRIDQNERSITQEVKDRTNKDRELSGKIEIEAGKITQIVQAVGKDGKVTAASIALAINNAGSSAMIRADQIILSGTTKLNDIMTVGSSRVAFSKPINVESSGNIAVIGATGLSVNWRHFDVANVVPSGNVLTITYWDGSTKTFSKATSLSGSWSGGTYTVTAKQNGTTVNSISEIITGTNISGTPTLNPSNSKYIDAVIEVKAKELGESGSGDTVYSVTKTINATAAYNAGASSVSHNIDIPSSQIYTTSGSPPSGATNLSTMKSRILTAISDSDTLVFRVDCGGTSKYYYMSF